MSCQGLSACRIAKAITLLPALSPDRGFHTVCGRKINISIRILQFLCCKTRTEARSHDHASASLGGLLSVEKLLKYVKR